MPAKPGIYFFKSASGEVVYIGKARSLRDRVRSYFLANPDLKVRNILRETADIDYILTGSEKEAAFLENNYVQQHQPRFNLRLKDDKSFPYLKITTGETVARRLFQPQGRARRLPLFRAVQPGRPGPLLHPPRQQALPRPRLRGGRLPRPQAAMPRIRAQALLGAVRRRRSPRPTTARTSRTPASFSKAGPTELARTLKARMEQAAAEERFEEAARLRDLLRTIEDYRDRPGTISTALEDQDVVGLVRSGGRAAVYVFFMRKGKIRNSAARARRRPGRRPRRRMARSASWPPSTPTGSFRPRLLLPAPPARTTGLQSLLGWAKVQSRRPPRRAGTASSSSWPAATPRPFFASRRATPTPSKS